VAALGVGIDVSSAELSADVHSYGAISGSAREGHAIVCEARWFKCSSAGHSAAAKGSGGQRVPNMHGTSVQELRCLAGSIQESKTEVVLECTHAFCRRCLNQWYGSSALFPRSVLFSRAMV
jgi:hypothetical protein